MDTAVYIYVYGYIWHVMTLITALCSLLLLEGSHAFSATEDLAELWQEGLVN